VKIVSEVETNMTRSIVRFGRRFLQIAFTVVRMRPGMVLARLRLEILGLRRPRRLTSSRRAELPEWGEFGLRASERIAPGVFRYCGLDGSVSELGWSGPPRDALWRFHQHYFNHLVAIEAPHRIEEDRLYFQEWARANQLMAHPAWHPYTASIRAVNLVKWDLNYATLTPQDIQIVGLHAEFVARNMELHLRGNHLFSNAKALIFLSAFLEHPRATSWAKKGIRTVSKELKRQVLPDGGHAELTPMYHSLFLEDILDLLHLSRLLPEHPLGDLDEVLAETASRMMLWLRLMEHSPGQLGNFGDTTSGVALSFSQLEQYRSALGIAAPGNVREQVDSGALALTVLPESGYCVLQHLDPRGPIKAIFDCGEIGLSYLPGHGHADTLSFELSMAGSRFVRNGGVSTYHDTPRRHHERGTAAHSTVVVDDRNSSEVWDSFRVGRSAAGHIADVVRDDSLVSVTGWHSGFSTVARRVVHRREISMGRRFLSVVDSVRGRHSEALARFILEPTVTVSRDNANRFGLSVGRHRLSFKVVRGSAQLNMTQVGQGFGRVESTYVIDVQLVAGECEVLVAWQ